MWMSVSNGTSSRAILWAVLAYFLAAPLSLPAQDDQPTQPEDTQQTDEQLPSLETCIHGLRKWRSTWKTIRIICDESNSEEPPEGNSAPDDPVDTEIYSGRHEFAWADWGAMLYKLRFQRDGRDCYVTVFGSDGTHQWSTKTEMEKPDVIKMVQVRQADSKHPLSCKYEISPLIGLWQSSTGRWLDERMAAEPWTVLGFEEVEGHRCVKVYWQRQRISNTVWLDPECRFLPRKFMELQKVDPSRTDVKREYLDPRSGEMTWSHGETWIAHEIREIGGVLFPCRGTDQTREVRTWAIGQVTVNEPLKRSFFEAPQNSSARRPRPAEETQPVPDPPFWFFLIPPVVFCALIFFVLALFRRRPPDP